MAIPVFQVDAFIDVYAASQAFTGNPAAVCLLEREREEKWMQAFASEMNLSETVFVVKQGAGYDLRWFTPKVEVDLCGHATLASAYALWSSGAAPKKTIRFMSKSGPLLATPDGEWINLDFPSEAPIEAPQSIDWQAMFGPSARQAGRKKNRMDFLLEFESEDEVRTLSPDFAKLANVDCRGVIVTARAKNKPYDFVSRFFAPKAGVNEDPVTGSAHCCLAPYWAAKLGKTSLIGYQASARGGVVRVNLQNDRVILGGKAMAVFEGVTKM
ncbi:MAG: PhzF family phenazine biosynthesis protein [Planctomycetaceae bacterium]|nr:PhzF family phenazine biosynthesis protein [Planctomycetaceae bacterium]